MNPMATLRVLWGALMTSVGLLGVVILILPPAQVSPDPTVLIVLAVTAASTAAVSFVLPRHIHARAASSSSFAVNEVPDPDAPAGFGDARRVRMFADPPRARQRAFMLYQQYTILCCALSESVAMFGVVLNRLGHPLTTSLAFVATGMVLVALRFPSEAKALELFQSATKARLS
jgi:hypothetical protein